MTTQKVKGVRKKLECPDKHTYSKKIYPALTKMLGKALCKCGKAKPCPIREMPKEMKNHLGECNKMVCNERMR